MTIYFLANEPHIAVANGFHAIDDQTYYMMIENGEIDHTEVIEHD